MRQQASSSKPPVVYSAAGMPKMALDDLWQGLSKPQFWLAFATFDIRQRFKRSLLGPLWITISTGVMIAALALVFSTIFNQSVERLIPYIATGLIFWNLLTATLLEGGQSFISAEGYIRSVPMPLSVHVYRVFARNIIVLLFNIAIYVIAWLIFVRTVTLEYVLFFPGFFLLLVNLMWMSISAAVISTRFRDIPQVISSVVQVVFFVTPIFWSLEVIPTRPAFVALNPVYHLIEVVRAPLLGLAPPVESWLACVALAVLGWTFTLYLFRRSYARIAYWV